MKRSKKLRKLYPKSIYPELYQPPGIRCICPCNCGCQMPHYVVNEATNMCPDCENGKHEEPPK